ncbi:hypothetical protein LJC59_01470 [Desulfovibrio sp. OttesenSCG-928-A18]|nr:hypothetical protein [Desulfovibrio sp. OttesenSCG-928-A18]
MMRTRLTSFVLTMALLLAASAASAEVTKFGMFSVDVPKGWNVVSQGLGIALLSPDNKCTITIAVSPSEGKNARTIARELAEISNGKGLKATEDGGWCYTAPGANNAQTFMRIYANKSHFIAYSIAGEHEEAQGIWDSLDSDDRGLGQMLKKIHSTPTQEEKEAAVSLLAASSLCDG